MPEIVETEFFRAHRIKDIATELGEVEFADFTHWFDGQGAPLLDDGEAGVYYDDYAVWLEVKERFRAPARVVHRAAMDYVVQAQMMLMRREPDQARELYRRALPLEMAAIDRLSLQSSAETEPTRSVLHRSAGWIAYHCGQYRQAVELADAGLAHDTPADLAQELRELRDMASRQF